MIRRKMFRNAIPEVFKRAKELRNNMTAAEMALWLHLKNGIYGCKFRRQHPIETYVVDFYCHKAKLVVEVDGSIHSVPANILLDKLREEDLKQWGYTVLRYTNYQVMKEIETVLFEINYKIKSLLSK